MADLCLHSLAYAGPLRDSFCRYPPLLALTMFFAIKMKVNRLKAADSLLINLWQIKQ